MGKNLMKTIIVSALSFLALLAVVSCAKPDTTFTLAGEYRDRSNDRIFAVLYKPDAAPETMRAYGMRATNTSGRMTTVYFLPEGSPSPAAALKAATSLEQATAAIAGSNGRAFVYQRPTNGKEVFVNCASDTAHELCQKQ